MTVTAWQTLFDYAHVAAGQTVLIHGAAGNVGAYAVQLAKLSDLHVVATAASAGLDYVRGLGAETVMDYETEQLEESLNGVDIVLDTVGGETQERSLRVLSYHLFLRQHKNVMAFEQRTFTSLSLQRG